MNQYDLEGRGIEKVFVRSMLSSGPHRVVALRGVNIAVPRGSIFGLVGESGSGKSTLARILVGLDRPTKGTALIRGENPYAVERSRRSALVLGAQMVFQDPYGALDPRMSVGASLGEALRAARVPKKEWPERIEELLRAVRMDPSLGRRAPSALSGGQRQRVVIARALACDPSFIALDEPVSSLDLSVQAGIIDLLLDIRERRGLGYLLVSHDLNLVAAICDRAAVMKDGLIVEEGDARSLATSARHPFTAELHEKNLRMGDRDRGVGFWAGRVGCDASFTASLESREPRDAVLA